MGVLETPPRRCREPLGPDAWRDAAAITVPSQDKKRQKKKQLPMVRLYLVMVAIVCIVALEGASMLVHAESRSGLTIGRQLGASEPSLSSGSASSESSSSSSRCSQEQHHSNAFEPVLFFLLAYLCSAVAQELMLLFPENMRAPHSVNLFFLGMLLAQCSRWIPNSEFGHAIRDFQVVDPHIIFWVLLPAILYEDSSNVNWYVMKKVLPSCILLAIPGVILNALLTGFLIKSLFGTVTWTWDASFLMGTILSATDPVAVMGALHELQAPDKLSHLVSGESLVNDGSAVVVFHLFWDSARRIRVLTPGYSVGFFMRLALGGPILGFVTALLGFQWLKRTRTFSIEIIVIMVAIYGGFFISEHSEVKVSGVLAVVVFGFFMAAHGHFSLNIDEEQRHEAILHLLALLSNEAIFVLAGVVGFRFMREGELFGRDWLELLLLYVIVHFTRAFIMLLFWPLLRNWGYGVQWKEGLICVLGGLRGAVGLAMALMVEFDDRMSYDVRSRIAFHTSGIVLGTLFINGTFITTIYKKLHIYAQAEHHEKLLIVALKKADALTKKRVAAFEQHWFFHNCAFADVWRLVPSLAEAAHPPQGPNPGTRQSARRQSQASRISKVSGQKSNYSSHTRVGGKSVQLKKQTSRLSTYSVHGRPSSFANHVNADHWSIAQEVNEIMTQVARKLGGGADNLETHFMQKIRNRRKKGGFPNNIFLLPALPPHDTADDSHHEVIELALQMLRDDLKRATCKVAEADGGMDLDDAVVEMSATLHHLTEGPLPAKRQSVESNYCGTQSAPFSEDPRRRQSDELQYGQVATAHSSQYTYASSGQMSAARTSIENLDRAQSTTSLKFKSRGSLMSVSSALKGTNMEPGRVSELGEMRKSATGTESNCSKVFFQLDHGEVAPAGDEAFNPKKKKPVKRTSLQRASLDSKGLQEFFKGTESVEMGMVNSEASSISTLTPSRPDKMHRLFARMGAIQELRKRAAARAHACKQIKSKNTNEQLSLDVKDDKAYTSEKSKAVAGLLQDAGTMVQTLTDNVTKAMNLKDIIARAMGNQMVSWVERKTPMEVERLSSNDRATYRWRFAIQRVMWALRKIMEAQNARQRLWDDIEQENGSNHPSRMRFTLSSETASKENFIEDAHSMEEIFLTVLNAQRASYMKMFEARALSEHAYRTLMEATEYQEEAIYGELRRLPYKPSGDLLDPKLRTVNQMNHQDQMALSFAVGWQYISEVTKNEVSHAAKCGKFAPCLVSGEWWVLRRDIEMVLAFIVVAERILEEPMLRPFKNQVTMPLMKVCEMAKVGALYHLMKQDSAMFALFEHILCAKLVIGSQRRLLEELRMEGTLNDHDAEHIMRQVLGPVQEALDDYIPTREQLHLAIYGPPKTVMVKQPIGGLFGEASSMVPSTLNKITQSMGFGFLVSSAGRDSTAGNHQPLSQRMYESIVGPKTARTSQQSTVNARFSGNSDNSRRSAEPQSSKSYGGSEAVNKAKNDKHGHLSLPPLSQSQPNFTPVFPNDALKNATPAALPGQLHDAPGQLHDAPGQLHGDEQQEPSPAAREERSFSVW